MKQAVHFLFDVGEVLWQVTLMIHFAMRRLRLKVAIVPIFLLESMGMPEVSSPLLHPLMLRPC
jgi:hypothetical protein